MSKFRELKAQAEVLLQQAEEARRQELSEIIASVKALISEYELSAEDLGFSASDKKIRVGRKVAVKYRDPVSGGEWSGRGRPPRWIIEREAEGRERTEFLVG